MFKDGESSQNSRTSEMPGCRSTLRPASNMQLSGKRGDRRVTIAGSRASETWEMRIEGPHGLNGRILWLALPENMNQRRSED